MKSRNSVPTVKRWLSVLLIGIFLISHLVQADEAVSFEQYRENYRAQVRKHPTDLKRHRALIAQAYRDNQLQVPIAIYEDSYRRNPDHPVVLYVLGYTYLVEGSEGSLARAEPLLQRAAEIQPDSADILAALGLAYLKRGKAEKGLPLLQKVLTLNPNFNQAILALARYYQENHQYTDALSYYRRSLEIDNRSAKVHLETAKIYQALQDYKNGVLHAREATRRDKKSGEAYYLLGQLYALQGEADKAIGAYQRGREYDPQNTEARYRLAQIFLDQNNGRYAVLSVRSALAAEPAYADLADRLKGVGIAEAAEVITRILEERPGNPGLQLFLGKLRLKFGDTAEARKHLEIARELEPENSEVRTELGKVYESQNQPELAAREYQEAVTLGSAEELPLKRLAETYLQEGKEDLFLDTVNRLFAINPKYPDLQSAAGRIYLRRSREAARAEERLQADKYAALALDHYDMAAKLEPGNAGYQLQLANLYASQNKLKALTIFEDAIALDPGNPAAYYSRAKFMLQYRFGVDKALLYSIEDVLADLQKAIELKPDYAEAYSALGLAYERAGQPQNAMTAYQKAVQLNPNDIQAHGFLGHWYKSQGEYFKAIHSFRQVAESRPDDVAALKGFAFLTLMHNEATGWKDAQKALKRLLELQPEDPEVLMNYGYTLYLEKRYPEAIEYYLRSVKLDPDNAQTHFNLALAYELIKDKDKARTEWQRVIELDYNGRYADVAIERLASLGGE